jgi:MFS family permease
MCGAQLASRVLYPILGPRRHVSGGLVGVAAAIGLMALVGPQTNLWWMRLLMYLMGFAMAQVFVPIQAAAFATITPAATGRASTMFNAVRQLGSAVGVAVFTTAVVAVGATVRVGHAVRPNLAAYHAAFLVAAALAAVGALAALALEDGAAAATIPQRRRRPAGSKELLLDGHPAEVTAG